MKVNYAKIFEEEIRKISMLKIKPGLLLHACCAPCASYVLEELRKYFHITVYFFNPNIFPEQEHNRRFSELDTFLKKIDPERSISLIYEKYSPMEFAHCSSGLESEPEGGVRCFQCYDLRLSKTAEKARELKIEYFTTTLTISPHKNSTRINESGGELAGVYGVKYLFSDFKKNNGFKRSAELSREFDLYRQDYCGCEFSTKRSAPE
jgi:epoxyqueuosine reductase